MIGGGSRTARTDGGIERLTIMMIRVELLVLEGEHSIHNNQLKRNMSYHTR